MKRDNTNAYGLSISSMVLNSSIVSFRSNRALILNHNFSFLGGMNVLMSPFTAILRPVESSAGRNLLINPNLLHATKRFDFFLCITILFKQSFKFLLWRIRFRLRKTGCIICCVVCLALAQKWYVPFCAVLLVCLNSANKFYSTRSLKNIHTI